MNAHIQWREKNYQADLSRPIDLSIPIVPNQLGPNCFYAPMPEAAPVREGSFIGSITDGAPVNFFTLTLNPHGNGTHTECVGHITAGPYYIHKALQEFFMPVVVVSLYPEKQASGDRVIKADHFFEACQCSPLPPAVIIRTLPNGKDKTQRVYSGTNPPYIEPELAAQLSKENVKHLLTDLPSVDKEKDGGVLAAHHAFWKKEDSWRTDCTISELLYVPDLVTDGIYLLQMNVLHLQLDASPSRPMIYRLEPI